MTRQSIFDKYVLMLIGGICLLALVVGITRVIYSIETACPDIKITTSTKNIKENTSFSISAINPNITSWDWDFGDNKPHQTGKIVTYTYKNAGQYNVKLTVNGNERCTEFLVLNVAADISEGGMAGSGPQPIIDGPSTAFVGKPVIYHEISGKAQKWEWTSTETNQVDATGQDVTYTFATPGLKTIYVTIDDKGKTSMDVNVQGGGGGGGAGKSKVDEVVFRQMLYQVINRKADVNIFKDCLCGKINMVITAVDKGGGKPYAFDGYCKQIRSANYKTEIDEVKLTTDAKTGCIMGVVIKQHTGTWAPFRK